MSQDDPASTSPKNGGPRRNRAPRGETSRKSARAAATEGPGEPEGESAETTVSTSLE